MESYNNKCCICGIYQDDNTNYMIKITANTKRCPKWLSNLHENDFNNELTATKAIEKQELGLTDKYVCKKHFTGDCFTKNGKVLKKNAVPTLELFADTGQSRFDINDLEEDLDPLEDSALNKLKRIKYKICRICLVTGVKMYDINKYKLLYYYENLLSVTEATSNTLPICYECATLLYKCYKFKQKCLKGQEIITKLSQNRQMSLNSINKVDRVEAKLNSDLKKSEQTNLNVFSYKYEEINEKDITNKTNRNNIKTDINEINNSNISDNDIDSNDIDNIEIDGLINYKKHKTQKTIFKKIDKSIINNKKVKKFTKTIKDLEISNNKLKRKDDKKKNKTEIIKLDETKWNRVVLDKEEVFREFNRRGEINQNSAFNCDLCFQGFCSKDTLLRHMTMHSEDRGMYKCEVCKKRFRWKTKLKCHMMEHSVRYHCLRCPKICLTVSQVNVHEKFHQGINYLCKICGAKFVKVTTYYSHLRLKHRSQHVCQTCGASFVSDNGLSQHRTRVHGNIQQDVKTDAIEDLNCHKCNIQFDNKLAFDSHITHSANHSEIVNKEQIDDKINNKTTDSLKCNECEEWFKSKEAKKRHQKRVHSTKSDTKYEYICEICGAGVTKSCVWQHKNSHTRGLVFACTVCGRSFNSPANRYRHMVTHTGEKPFDCKLCDKKFTQRCNLKIHFWSYHLKQPYPYVRNPRRSK